MPKPVKLFLQISACWLSSCGDNPLGRFHDVDGSFDPIDSSEVTETPHETPSQGAVEQASATIDDEPPTVTGLSVSTTLSTAITWEWGCTEVCSYRFLVDQQATSNPSGEFADTTAHTLSEVDGTYYLHVQAQDAAGNLSAVVHVSAILDGLGPTLSGSLTMNANDGFYDRSPTAVWNVATDSGSGVSGYQAAIALEDGDNDCDANDIAANETLAWTSVPDDADFSDTGWQIQDGNVDASGNQIDLSLTVSDYCLAVRGVDSLGNLGTPIYSSTWDIFQPTDISALQLWLDGEDSATIFQDTACTTPVTSSGQSVACWSDKSTNAIDATQATGASQPTYRTSVLNGRDSIRFGGSHSLLVAAAGGPINAIDTGDFTILFVADLSALSSRQWVISNIDGTFKGLQLGATTADTFSGLVGSATLLPSTLAVDGSYRMFMAERDNTDQVTLYGDTLAVGNDFRAITVNGGATYLGRQSNAATEFFTGDLLEIVVFDAILTNTQKIEISRYLVTKYDLPIPLP